MIIKKHAFCHLEIRLNFQLHPTKPAPIAVLFSSFEQHRTKKEKVESVPLTKELVGAGVGFDQLISLSIAAS
jgi:hypothetical protein